MEHEYVVLKKQVYLKDFFSIVPLRYQDRYEIMNWRNEQLSHLRQKKPLNKKDQDEYFDKVVAELFEKDQPEQILFSYLKNSTCIGYGGLVHINWSDKNAELSFIMNTNLEKTHFKFHWKNFSQLIEEVAFQELRMHKIFTYSFNVRPYIYEILEEEGFVFEAELKEHYFYNNDYISVKIHSKFNKNEK